MAQQINLYDPALQRQRDWLALGNVVGLAVFLTIVVGGAGYLARLDLPALNAQAAANESQLKAARDQIAALGQQAASRKPDLRVEQEVAAKRILLSARDEVLATLRKSLGPEAGGSFAAYLQGFARQTVSGLWLAGFSVDAIGGGMEIHGYTIDPALLPEYIRRLNKETAFQGREFAALTMNAKAPDAPVAGTSTAAAVKALPAPSLRAPYHEFKLIPAKTEAASKTGGPAKLTHNAVASPSNGGAG